ncbi:MAG: response regulator [Bdellovibrionaceae bacterium]|nr:response regulator [Pseudobdellovibrionaceae bacterium]
MSRILLVDDQESIQKLVEGILQSRGYSVTCVANAFDAMDKLENYPFDMVITDVMMPNGVTGFELTRNIRKSEKFGSIAVIILTGRREQRDVEKGIDAGTDDYVIKPIDPDILISKVDSLLKKIAKPENNFLSATVSELASWDTRTEIVSISEIGVVVMSEMPAMVGAKVKLQSGIFDNIGISVPSLRVISCKPMTVDSVVAHSVELHFIGMSEKSLQPLRLWIRNHMMKKPA